MKTLNDIDVKKAHLRRLSTPSHGDQHAKMDLVISFICDGNAKACDDEGQKAGATAAHRQASSHLKGKIATDLGTHILEAIKGVKSYFSDEEMKRHHDLFSDLEDLAKSGITASADVDDFDFDNHAKVTLLKEKDSDTLKEKDSETLNSSAFARCPDGMLRRVECFLRRRAVFRMECLWGG
jgi:hypothetical protein